MLYSTVQYSTVQYRVGQLNTAPPPLGSGSDLERPRLSGKIRWPKSTLSLLLQTEIHLRSPTIMPAGILRAILSPSDLPRTGALWSLYL